MAERCIVDLECAFRQLSDDLQHSIHKCNEKSEQHR